MEDNLPWFLKFLSREACISPHAFHLYEIYRLTLHEASPAQQLTSRLHLAERVWHLDCSFQQHPKVLLVAQLT